MRVNPKYDNTCIVRIGMYREKACIDCSKKEECDQHYNNETGEWNYGGIENLGARRIPPSLMHNVSPEAAEEITRRNRQGRRGKGGQQSTARHHREQYEVSIGVRAPVEYKTNVYEALAVAGMPYERV